MILDESRLFLRSLGGVKALKMHGRSILFGWR